MTRFKLFPKRRPFFLSKINHRTSPLPSSPEQHPTLLFQLVTQLNMTIWLLQLTIWLITLLSVLTLTALLKYILTQFTLFLHCRFKLQSLCLHLFHRTIHYSLV